MRSGKTASGKPFTDSVRRIAQQIPLRAHERGLWSVDAFSIIPLALWTLVQGEKKVGLVALDTLGVDLEALVRGLDSLLNKDSAANPIAVNERNVLVFKSTGQPVPPIVRTADSLLDPLLSRAEEESRALKHDWVGTEHLLLAIISTADAELSSLLQRHGVIYESIQETILELLCE